MIVQLAISTCPLSDYLKAVGLLRIVSQQLDPSVRGWWHNGRFVLGSPNGLEPEGLRDFLLYLYQPTPILSPWNGSTGFSERDQPSQKQLLADFRNAEERFEQYGRAIQVAQQCCQGQLAAPKGEEKLQLLKKLRNRLPDAAIGWLDLALPIVTARRGTEPALEVLEYNPLTRTGGNDGNFELSRTFMQQLKVLFDLGTGEPTPEAALLLRAALFDECLPNLPSSGKIGMYNPAGYNNQVNAWDSVLLMEGLIAFAPAINSRLVAVPDFDFRRFLFMVYRKEDGSDEFFAPVWAKALTYVEVRQSFLEEKLGSSIMRDVIPKILL